MECCNHKWNKRYCFCHNCYGYDPEFAGYECDVEKERMKKA